MPESPRIHIRKGKEAQKVQEDGNRRKTPQLGICGLGNSLQGGTGVAVLVGDTVAYSGDTTRSTKAPSAMRKIRN